LDFDEAVALRWGILNADLLRRGRKMPLEDSYIAAPALVYDLTIATRNESDFAEAGIRIVNPWKEQNGAKN